MRGLAALAVIAVLAGPTARALGAPKAGDDEPTAAQYQHEIDELGVLATLQGHDIRAADVLPPSTPFPLMFGSPESEQARRNLLEFAMARVRRKAVVALAAALIPDCPTDPTPDDVTAFFPFWRAVFAKQTATIDDNGVSRPYPSAAEINAIRPELAGAKEVADRFIRGWRLDQCIQQKYGGKAFRTWRVERGGLVPALLSTDKWIEAPDLNVLTPNESLEDLLLAARKAGLLSFPSEAYRSAFMRPYGATTSPSSCFNDVDAAVAYFRTPPWRGGVFPPVAKEQRVFRTSPMGSSGFEVSSAAGWQACILGSGVLTFERPDLKIVAAFAVFPDGKSDPQAIMNDLGVVTGHWGFPPPKKLGTAAIAGVAGDMFSSELVSQGQRVVIETTIIRLDALSFGMQLVMKPSPPTLGDIHALDQLLSTVKVLNPTLR